MAPADPQRWLLLIHQIPPQPNALRVKIWRRLQQLGAVGIKQSVYAMPLSEQSREDLSWTLKEIQAGGGDGSISEACFVEGLTDEQIIALFQKARKADYEKVIQDANRVLAQWSSARTESEGNAARRAAQVSRLQRRLAEVAAIDFFQSPERGSAELSIHELTKGLPGWASTAAVTAEDLAGLKGQTWVTRKNLFVDRLACGWLIRRFVDAAATFKYVDAAVPPAPGELRFDMFDAEYTHERDQCTFEVMIRRLRFQDPALEALAEVVHDIDLKDHKYDRDVTEGFSALLTGLVASQPDDDLRMTAGFQQFESLYAYFKRRRRESRLRP